MENKAFLQLNPNEPQINPDKPWEFDKLKRKDCADKLTEIIKGQTSPLTISVNGSWGTGKTFLLKRWKAQLELDKYKVIYFNAWEDDFLKDPLLSIIGQLFKEIPKDGVYKNIIPAIQENAIPIVMATANIIIPLIDNTPVIGPIIDLLKSIWNFLKRLSKHSAQKKLFDEYGTLCESKIKLTESLEKLADTIHEKTERPLIFIIDELDRCRPTYAIETLERIKHLFHIKNMIFVLGISRESLEKSIRSVYGCIDTFDYLRRFIDFEFNLPIIENKVFFDALWERFQIQDFINKKSDEFLQSMQEDQKKNGASIDEKKLNEIIENYKSEIRNFQSRFYSILKWHEFTLREIEQCMKLLALALQSYNGNHAEVIAIIILIILKIKFPKQYNEYLKNKSNPKDIANTLIPNKIEDDDKNSARLFSVIIYRTFCPKYEKVIDNLFDTVRSLVDKSVKNQINNISDNPVISDFLKKQCKTSFSPDRDSVKHSPEDFNGVKELYGMWERYSAYTNVDAFSWKDLILIAQKIDLISIKSH